MTSEAGWNSGAIGSALRSPTSGQKRHLPILSDRTAHGSCCRTQRQMGDGAARSAVRARRDVPGVLTSIEAITRSLEVAGWPLYAGPREVWREVGDRQAGQREIFVLAISSKLRISSAPTTLPAASMAKVPRKTASRRRTTFSTFGKGS